MWRGHNREHVLESNEDKNAYLNRLMDSLSEKITPFVDFYSFCIMGNHPHETGALKFDSQDRESCLEALGNWMRNAHSRFGYRYNRRHQREGKVAYDRPKTKEIEDDTGLLRTMFYGDVNPVRAGMVSHPSRYQYSTYMLYAYGKRSWFTEKLTLPEAYLALGKTPEMRRKKYRQLCDQYMRENNLLQDQPPENETPLTKDTKSEPEPVQVCARGDPDTG